jgi:hypothetical protein
VYQTEIDSCDDTDYPDDAIHDSGYKAYHVDADILEIMVNNTNTNRFGINDIFDKVQATFPSRDEWNKLTQQKKD